MTVSRMFKVTMAAVTYLTSSCAGVHVYLVDNSRILGCFILIARASGA